MLLRDNSSTMLFTAVIFFFILSTSINLTSGKKIAKGIPGNPPPVPKSTTTVFFLNLINFAIERE